MNNSIAMTVELDRQKKIQAAAYTAVIAGAILLIVWFVRFYQPVVPPAPQEEYIEIALPEPPVEDVNLGNNDVGSGNVQPIVTGSPSSAPVSQDIAQSKADNTQQATKDFDEDDDRNSPVITKPSTQNKSAKEINNNSADQSVTAKPQLKKGAQMTSVTGSGSGGNTDLPGYNKPGSQGPGDGRGDKGTFNANPKGTNYGGPQVTSGNRQIIRHYAFRGDLPPAKIHAEIKVSPDGKGTFIRIIRGIQTQAYKNEIIRYLGNITFNKAASESKVVVEFIFDQDNG